MADIDLCVFVFGPIGCLFGAGLVELGVGIGVGDVLFIHFFAITRFALFAVVVRVSDVHLFHIGGLTLSSMHIRFMCTSSFHSGILVVAEKYIFPSYLTFSSPFISHSWSMFMFISI